MELTLNSGLSMRPTEDFFLAGVGLSVMALSRVSFWPLITFSDILVKLNSQESSRLERPFFEAAASERATFSGLSVRFDFESVLPSQANPSR